MSTPKVQFNVGGTWTDATGDVRVDGGVGITRGGASGQSAVAPGSLKLSLHDPTGTYSTRNPLSPFFGQLGRNTPVRVGVDPMADTFTRSVVDGWGTSSSGHAWSVVSGTAANFDVGGSTGTIVANSSTLQAAVLPGSYGEADVLVKLNFSTLTGNPDAGIITHWQDASNHFRIYVSSFATDILVDRRASGGPNSVSTIGAAAISVAANTDYWLRANVGNGAILAKFWATTDPEPDWMLRTWVDDAAEFTPALPRKGKVGLLAVKGTAATVTFDDLSVNSWRFHGEVRSWPPRWDKSGTDVSTPIEAAGLLNRLSSSGQAALQSPMYREATKPSVQQYTVALWPCEDESGATQFASAVPGGLPLKFTGPMSPAQNTNIPGAKPLAVFGTLGGFDGPVPKTPSTTGSIFYRIVLDVPDSPSTADNTNILNVYCTGGNIVAIRVYYLTVSSGSFAVRAMNAAGTVIDETSFSPSANGKRFYFSVECVQSGGNVNFLAGINVINDDLTVSSGISSDTWTGVTLGRAYRVNAGSMDGWGFGFVGVGSNQAFMFSMANALVGNAGELAAARMVRVAADAGIAFQLVGESADTMTMGAQVLGSALDVMRSCEAADAGVLYESRNELGLTYRTRTSMQNQTGPVLDYADSHVNVIEPVDDDQALWNDVTVNRTGGSSARATLDVGPLSTQDPPDGAGRIEAPDLNVAVRFDTQLPDIAGWRLHLGTWDEQRFRALGVQHAAPVLQAAPDLRAQLAALDTGDRFEVDNPPPWLPPDAIGQMVQGYSEVIAEDGADLWSIDWNTTPAGPWNVAEADGEPRVDTDGSALAAAVSSGATSLLVVPTDPDYQLWVPGTTVSNTTDFPMDIIVAGERMTVTAIADSVTDTFTRSVSNGWGTATSGQAWTVTGTASDYSVTGTVGRIATTTIASLYLVTVDSGSTDQTVSVSETLPVVPTGAAFTLRCVGRFTDASNFYNATVNVATTGAATVSLSKNVGGTGTTIASAVPVGTHAAGNQWMIVLQVIGSTVRAKAWNASQSGPVPVWQVTATDTDLTAGTRAGCGVRRETSNTDGTQNVDFDNFGLSAPQLFTVTRSVNGVVKAQTAGTAVNVFEPAYAPL